MTAVGINMKLHWFSFAILALYCTSEVEPAKVLMMPGPHNSNTNFFSKAGRALQDDGHEVYVLTTKSLEFLVDKAGIEKLIHEVSKEKDIYIRLEPVLKRVSKGNENVFKLMVSELLPVMADYCKELFHNKELMENIKSKKFDLVVNDGIMFYSCLYILPYKLGVPHISLSALYNPWTFGVPAMPSIEPSQLAPSTNKMSFFERALAIIPYAFLTINPFSVLYSNEFWLEFVPEQPYKSFAQLMSESEINLVNNDVICNGYPRISAPNYHFIGGTSATPARPLPDDMQQFADGAKEGLIVLSFGSLKTLQSIWPTIKPKFMAAFKKLPQRAIIQYSLDDVTGVPDNVMLVKWLPQNDLLGHPNTKLFITHGGSNGQLEAVYHGVPLLTIPFTGDQEYNAGQAGVKGFGLSLNRLTMSEDEIYNTMTEMLNNPKYANSVKKCSAIQKSMPSSQESFVFWVNHVLRFGGDHLKPPSIDMPLYQVFMLDVLLFFAFVFVLFVAMFLYTCRFCYRRICKPSKKSKTE